MKIILIGRKNCNYSKKLKFYIKKRTDVVFYTTSKYGEDFKKKIPTRSILISFRNTAIIKKNILKKTLYAINFHAAPPTYRGIGAPNFALLNNEKLFGSTCHLMNEKVDSGKIIHVKYFSILKDFNLKKLLNKTHKIMYNQAIEIVDGILNEKNFIKKLLKKNSQIKWSKKLYSKKQMLELYKIKKNFNKYKIKKICRATIYDKFFPYYEINGRKFFIKK